MKETNKIVISLLIVSLFIITAPKQVMGEVHVSAYGAILMEQDSGRVLFEKNAHEPQRIASITKIMTAILAIESGKLAEKVTISKRAVYTEGSRIYVKEEDEVYLEDLVYGLMLRSGNDAAIAIAEHVGGSVEGFVFLMNEKAAELGMKNTVFSNPHGLDDHEDHYSTPYDMALLTRYAMLNETYRLISGTKKYKNWRNKNRLLTEIYEYCTGGKTGFTKRANRTLVTTATKSRLNLITVTLNAPNDWNDHKNLYEHGFRHYDMVEVLSKGKVKAITPSMNNNDIFLKRSFYYPITSKEADLFHIQYKLVKPQFTNSANNLHPIVGKAEIYFNKELIKELPLYVKEEKKQRKRFFEYWKGIFSSIIGVDRDG